jgi:hypothetical protein
MKNLSMLVGLLLLILVDSCEKSNLNEKFVGMWMAQKSSIKFEGYPTTKEGFLRILNEDGTAYMERYSPSDLSQVITSTYKCENKTVTYSNYTISSLKPSCSTTRYDFYNISARLVGDTLYESGSFDVYINGEGIRSINTYTAKFVKIK